MRKYLSVDIKGIEKVFLEKSKKARNLVLSLESRDEVRVAVPRWVSYLEAENIISRNPGWITGFVNKVKVRFERAGYPDSADRVYPEKEIIRRLRSRTVEMARKYGFSIKGVTIRRQKTIWGSCSQDNSISLNIKLSRLRDELVDYVILHELVHTVQKDHRVPFWERLGSLINDPRILDRELKRYCLRVM